MYDYRAYLQGQLRASNGPGKKAIRTAIQIELAIAELLSERAFQDISVDHVAERAGMAHGTFYRYFPNTTAAVAKMASDYYKFLRETRPPIPADATTFDAIYIATLHYIKCFKHNLGIARCISHATDYNQEMIEVGRQADASLADRVLRRYAKMIRPKRITAAEAVELRLRIYSLISMVDETLLKIYGQTNPPLREYQAKPELIAETLSHIWHKALYETAIPLKQNARRSRGPGSGVTRTRCSSQMRIEKKTHRRAPSAVLD